jgi:molybdate transport system substrate-binding protein
VSSSGKLTAQIRSGAPFEVFLSADTKYPDELHKAGFAAQAPKVYAYGSLVLWSREKRDLPQNLRFLTGPQIARIAVANPKLAPYGEAAVQALTYYKLYPKVEKKLVFGESIAQVNQYVLSGAAPVGFTAKSVVLDPAARAKAPGWKWTGRRTNPLPKAWCCSKKASRPAPGSSTSSCRAQRPRPFLENTAILRKHFKTDTTPYSPCPTLPRCG